jgi:D-beta-D-heptose 7-phosphate kinase / D-beta-D-heptose 1-phosphate adenosyltransferase
MFDYETCFSELSRQTVLCVGDLMLDHFAYGEVTRISPEAPTPVIAIRREENVIGGAGNVARNIGCLGANCIYIGVMGQDEAGNMLARQFVDDHPNLEPHLIVDLTRPTTRKVRFVSEHHSTHLLRADWEISSPVSADVQRSLITAINAVLPRVGAIALSDYGKGTLTTPVIRALIDGARQHGKRILVDPKGNDYRIYHGANIITPNRKELAEAVHAAVDTADEIASAAQKLADIVDSEAVLVTRSEEGMTLYRRDQPVVHIPAYPVKVRDVSGAGDTVLAVMSILLAMNADYELASRTANAAAAVAVGKRGTATVTLDELRHRLLPSATLASEDKIVFDWAELTDRVAEWRRKGLRIGFTNGCFDLLHPGHVRVLSEARAACDRLVVGLNSDASTRRLKGEGRPIQPAQARAGVLAALEAVDLVVIFEQDTPIELISALRPDVLVKGGDYQLDQVVGREIVEAAAGEVILVPLVAGHSTTSIVNRSRKSNKVVLE